MLIKITPPEDKRKPKVFDDLRTAEKETPVRKDYGNNYFVCSIPLLPSWTNKTLKQTDRYGNENKINLYKLTCTCSDFIARKWLYRKRDIRQCCKHIYYKFTSTAAAKLIDPLTLMFIHSSAVFNEGLLYKFNIKDKVIYFGFTDESDWINVYSPGKWENNVYAAYSFNPVTEKWSYGIRPPHSNLMEHDIKVTLEHQLPYEHKYVKVNKILKD